MYTILRMTDAEALDPANRPVQDDEQPDEFVEPQVVDDAPEGNDEDDDDEEDEDQGPSRTQRFKSWFVKNKKKTVK